MFGLVQFLVCDKNDGWEETKLSSISRGQNDSKYNDIQYNNK